MFASRGPARNFPEVRTVASFPNDISRAWLEYISVFMVKRHSCLRKQPTFRDATNCFPTKWCLRNERRNSILMTRHYPDLGSASDGLKKIPKHVSRSLEAVTTFTYLRQNREKTRHFMKKKNLKNLEGSYIGKWLPIFTGAPNGKFWEKGLKGTTKHE